MRKYYAIIGTENFFGNKRQFVDVYLNRDQRNENFQSAKTMPKKYIDIRQTTLIEATDEGV
jgi:hypothetical protein